MTGKQTKSKIVKITERPFTLSLPSGDYFRIEDIPEYNTLSHLKNVDFCWWQENEKTAYLLELKSYRKATKPPKKDKILDKLVGQAVDSVMLLLSVWSKTGTGKAISRRLPKGFRTYPGDGKIKVVFVIDEHRKHPIITLINKDVKGMLKGKMALVNVGNIAVYDLNKAKKKLPINIEVK